MADGHDVILTALTLDLTSAAMAGGHEPAELTLEGLRAVE